MSILSSNLRLLRAEKSMSQQKIANAIIISRAALSKYEESKSEPPINVLCRLAAYFEVTVDALVGEDMSHIIPE